MAKNPEIPICSTRSPEQVARALAAFGNQQPGRQFLAQQVAEILLPDSHDQNQRDIMGGMQEIFGEMQMARRFNRGYMGHMLSEPSIPALLGDILAREVGSNTVAREVAMVESRLEGQTMRYLMEMVGYDPKEASGTFCSGGTMANMTALAVARKVMETKYEKDGKPFPDQVWVLATGMAHYSIPKAVDLLGGPQHVIKIKTVQTEGLKMSIADLRTKIAEAKDGGIPIMAVVAVEGETETGLVDDVKTIAAIAREKGIFSIADGAYGAPYKMSRNGAIFEGIEDCDAVVVDVHKCLYTPYGGGVVMFRNSLDHAGLARGVMANYIGNAASADFEGFERQRPGIAREFRDGTGRLGAKRLEGSMSAGAILSTMAVWETMGPEGLATVYDLTLDRTQHLYQRLEQSELLRPYHEPELNLLCFTLRDDVLQRLGFDKYSDKFHQFITETRYVLDSNIEGEGGYYFSETDLPDESQGDPNKKAWTWRACIMNPWTTDEIVDAAVDNLELLIRHRLGAN